MITAGVDLSSQDARTARCQVEWSDEAARVLSLQVGTSDAQIVDLIRSADKVGIDVPLGWPVAFADAIAQHSGDGSWPVGYVHSDTLAVRYRRTDLATWSSMKGSPPLSVSTDKIALPAMRAAGLLSRQQPRIALDGSGTVVEVYPAAALKRWGFPSRGYKRRENLQVLGELVETFQRRTEGWLKISDDQVRLCLASDDAFDAVICALVARAHATSLCEPISEPDKPIALREGWIALPRTDSFDNLVK